MIAGQREPLRRRWWCARSGAALTAVVGIGLLIVNGPGAHAREENGPGAYAREEGVVEGRVVDRSGTGVARARVWAVAGTVDEPNTVAETTTDDQGRFVLSRLPVPGVDESAPMRPGGRGPGYDVLARAEDGRLAWWSPVFLSRQDRPTRIQLDLVEVADARGRLADQSGRPIAGAEILPVHARRQISRMIGAIPTRLPSALAATLRATTAEDGSFVVKGLPRDAELGARIQTPGAGTLLVYWRVTEPITITLDNRLGRIEGRYRTTHPGRLDGAPALSLQLVPSARTPMFRLALSRRIPVGPDGSFQFDALPPGIYQIGPEISADARYVGAPVRGVLVKPGDRVSGLEIPIQPTAIITGRVVEAETGKKLAGIRVQARPIASGPPSLSLPAAVTDAEGRYRLRVTLGKVEITASYPEGMGGSFSRRVVGPPDPGYPRLDVTADMTWPDLKFPRPLAIDGVVVDGRGKPVSRAEVLTEASSVNPSMSVPRTLTGRDGSFRLDWLSPDDLLAVWARSGEGMTDGAIRIRARDHKGKLTLIVDPGFAFRLRGTVADASAGPITGARILVYRKQTRPNGWSSSLWETLSTDASGRFNSGPLWPGDEYRLVVSADGYTRVETPYVAGQKGMSRGLGTIKLVGSGGHVAGKVVGSEGRPIADVAVFNKGNSVQPASVKTDPQGRFRLDGLLPGSKYVFAQKDGHRFTGVLVPADTDALTIRLLRSDEPPPAWSPGENPTADEERELAKLILIRLWESYGKQRADGRRAAAQNLGARLNCAAPSARIDLELALTWLAELGGQLDGDVRPAAVEAAAEIDAREAIALLNAQPDRGRQEELQKLAERFAETDPAKAIMFAEEAARANAINEPERIREGPRSGRADPIGSS